MSAYGKQEWNEARHRLDATIASMPPEMRSPARAIQGFYERMIEETAK